MTYTIIKRSFDRTEPIASFEDVGTAIDFMVLWIRANTPECVRYEIANVVYAWMSPRGSVLLSSAK